MAGLRLKQKFGWWLLALNLGLFVGASSANALGVGGLSIFPVPDKEGKARSWFIYTAAEGTEVRDQMIINNNKDEAATVLIFPSGYTVDEEDNIVKAGADTPEKPEPGYWLELDRSEVSLAPHSAVQIGLTLKIPSTANVGEHVGGIFIQEKSPPSETKGGGVKVRVHIGAMLVVNVPGEINRDLQINKITHRIDYGNRRALFLTFNVSNHGNVAIAPIIDTTIRGIFGSVGKQEAVQTTAVSRGETKNVDVKWMKRAAYFGRFKAEFDIHTGEKEQFNKDGTKTMLPDEIIKQTYIFWLWPWRELMTILLVVLVLYLIRSVWLYTIIMRRLRVKTEMYKVVSGDTLMKVANKLGVDARVLAKFNLLKWPYELKTGDVLLVPIGYHRGAEWTVKQREMFSDKEFALSIVGHLFRRRTSHAMVDTLGKPGRSGGSAKPTVLIAETGDTLGDVADFAGVPMTALAEYNRIKPPYKLRPGQQIKIPPKSNKRQRKR